MLTNLKLLRNEYKISQQRLADEIGVSQQSINQYENHDVEPDIAVLMRLADYFITSIDYIVGRTSERTTGLSDISGLNHSESELLRKYRTLDVSEKNCINVVIDTLSQK